MHHVNCAHGDLMPKMDFDHKVVIDTGPRQSQAGKQLWHNRLKLL
jgi:hypothetical protein